jgi:hypothetical protein
MDDNANIISLFEKRRSSNRQIRNPIAADQAGETFSDYCLMLLQQLDYLPPDHTIALNRGLSSSAIRSAQAYLLEKSYPTTFEEGGDYGFGLLRFS